ncbi:hypothetical protein LEMLEM_LOCUS17041, partial [Lemmus lemmus]
MTFGPRLSGEYYFKCEGLYWDLVAPFLRDVQTTHMRQIPSYSSS